MDLPRAKPRLGHRALRVPVTVPAARRSLRTRDVHQLVDEQCFPPSPSGRVGVEIEWLAACLTDPTEAAGPEIVGRAGAELPAGSRLTFEPGGQAELSSPPLRGIGPACASIAADAAALTTALADHGVGLIGLGLDPGPARRRCVDSPRYEAMEAYFDAQGVSESAAGRTMMRSTAAVQVNVDLGPTAADAARRWHRAHDVGPMLAAAFANSPLSDGAPSGWRSRRLAVWTDVDECRTATVDGNGELDPVRQWTDYALAARVMFIRRDESRFVPILEPLTLGDWIANGHELGFPTLDDVSYHFTTLFPPVRPRGWLEMRMIDSLPDPWWRAAVAVSTTLVCDDTAADAAADAIAPTRGRWLDAARHGLGHPDLAGAARDAFDVALQAMVRLGTDATTVLAVEAFVDRYVDRARCPADDRLDAWQDDGTLIPAPDQFAAATWA
jgi:glutamate--cysteine ligase